MTLEARTRYPVQETSGSIFVKPFYLSSRQRVRETKAVSSTCEQRNDKADGQSSSSKFLMSHVTPILVEKLED